MRNQRVRERDKMRVRSKSRERQKERRFVLGFWNMRSKWEKNRLKGSREEDLRWIATALCGG